MNIVCYWRRPIEREKWFMAVLFWIRTNVTSNWLDAMAMLQSKQSRNSPFGEWSRKSRLWAPFHLPPRFVAIFFCSYCRRILQVNRPLLFLLLRFSLTHIYVFHIPMRRKQRQEKVFYRRSRRHVVRFVFEFILLFYSDWRRCARFTIASDRLCESSILLSCRRCVALTVCFFSRTKMNNLFYFNGFVRCPFVRTLEKKRIIPLVFSVDVVFFVRLFASMRYYVLLLWLYW